MPPITALLHTENDALRLGRCLETLYACDEILIVDHGSRDGTVRIARQYGARVVDAGPGVSFPQHPQFDARGWILALEPRESLTESLAASLFAWKHEWNTESHAEARSSGTSLAESKSAELSSAEFTAESATDPAAFSVFLREERVGGWAGGAAAQTRLVPATWKAWNRNIPIHQASAIALRGELLRFAFP